MPAPSTAGDLIVLVKKSRLIDDGRLLGFLEGHPVTNAEGETPLELAQAMVIAGLLTKYQAEQLLMGRWRNFLIAGKYKLLERIGKGGMAMVFLCEHQVMKRLVALKILPTAHAEDRELLGRFHREARALSQLRHPNIVGAYDVDHADKLHFLVMEYVDGGDLDLIVRRNGPLAVDRAAHYIRQAAFGLQHAHESGLVHRDIKPGNLLVDRSGTVKLLDLGLARIFHETTDDLTTGRDVTTLLGTVDYLAPEQAVNSHDVDIRVDIYGLGATFYFLLAGRGLFEDGTVAQKLSWHVNRPPHPITEVRPDVPPGLAAVIEKMLAKRPEDRYQTPDEVVEALIPWTLDPIDPPDESELPRLSRAARGAGPPSSIGRPPSSIRTPAPRNALRPAESPSKATLVMASPGVATTQVGPATEPEMPTIAAPAPPSIPEPVRARGRGRKLAMATLALGSVAAILGGLAYWAMFGPGAGAGSGSRSVAGDLPTGPGPAGSPAAGPGGADRPKDSALSPDQAGDATVELIPGSGEAKPFATLRDALRAARPGDRIVITGSLLREAVELTDAGGSVKDLKIEGVNPDGGPVRWRGPRNLSPSRALLDASGVAGFQLRNFSFDGQGRVADLIRLTGSSPGSVLDGVRAADATRACVVLRGWSGDSGRPAILRNLRLATAEEAEAGILIEPNPDRPDDPSCTVQVRSCRFVGPFLAAVQVAGAVDDLHVEHCRFFRATDGLRYRRTTARPPLRVLLHANTFAELQRGLHFETTPAAAGSEVILTNNVFSGTPRLAMLDGLGALQPARPSGRWIWTDEGKRSPSIPPGDRDFRKTFDLVAIPEAATLDIGCDETFTAWINGVEVRANPVDHFTQRVYAIPVADRLRVGRNVIAVKGSNKLDRIDPKFGTTAGLMVQLTARVDGRDQVLARSDESWLYNPEPSPQGWILADFDDRSWNQARPWPDAGSTWPWAFAVWDSSVLPQLRPPLEPIPARGSGNFRDYKSWEGYPMFDSERVVLAESTLPKDPEDDAKFLRQARAHPLFRAGPAGSPVGVFVGD